MKLGWFVAVGISWNRGPRLYAEYTPDEPNGVRPGARDTEVYTPWDDGEMIANQMGFAPGKRHHGKEEGGTTD